MPNITDNLKNLAESQQAEKDNRKAVREADHFLNKRNGQWEQDVAEAWSDRPRYTFDQCNPVVDNIMSDIEVMDFGVKVRPTGGGASKIIAGHYGGILRNLENISNAKHIYNSTARIMVGTGLAGARVVQQYRDSDSFQQDLMIKSIRNFKDRVWYDADAIEQNMSDAMECWVLTSFSTANYLKKWPKGSEVSVSNGRENDVYYDKKPNEVIVGEYYHRKKFKRKLALLSNNQVVVIDKDFNKVRDEMFSKGITVSQTRTRDAYITYHRHFDGSDWLSSDKETVFEYIPVVPCYANFTISEDKVIYWGVIDKLMDPQRVLNYAESKKVAESALKPVEKTWIAKEQMTSPDVINTISTLNTNADPVQVYDSVEGIVPPFKPQVNQPDGVLIETAASSKQYIKETSGVFNANKGEGLAGQSGETVRLLQKRGTSANYKYFTSMEIFISHICDIMRKAVPKVYDTQQEMQILNEDGTFGEISVKEHVTDDETGDVVALTDLSKGSYSLTCSAGLSFNNRQQEMITELTGLGQTDPSIVQMGADILLANNDLPGMMQIAERKRVELLSAGVIPASQQTPEEKAAIKKVEESKQMSPTDEANLGIAKAEMEKAQAQTQDTLSKMQERQDKAQLEMQKLMLDAQVKQQELQDTRDEKMIKIITAQSDNLNKQAQTLKILREAMGVDTAVGPDTAKAYNEQADVVLDAQQKQ